MRSILLFVFLVQFCFGQQQFDLAKVQKFQKELNAEYANPNTSPLDKEDLASFKGLDFYTINENFFVLAKFIRTPKEKPFKMKTSTDRKPLYVKYGEVHFVLDGKNLKLNLYRDIALSKNNKYKDYLFLPFFDDTCGKESYLGGRYIDLTIPKGDTIAIDFNTAYNPYCAYSHYYSCPKVPLENDLNIAIKAGVKKIHD